MKRKEIEKQATESEINIDKRICGQAENGFADKPKTEINNSLKIDYGEKWKLGVTE
jgi:hypothetical protein